MSDNIPTKEELDEVATQFFKEISERRNQSAAVPSAPKIEVSFVNSEGIQPFIKTPLKDKVKTITV